MPLRKEWMGLCMVLKKVRDVLERETFVLGAVQDVEVASFHD
jgi:hypothetical protein